MRRLLLAIPLATLALAACVDLFHDTSDLRTTCEIDPHAAACPDADFCALAPDEARQQAAHACAWLGACETPMGRNAFGDCMFEGLLAFDCAANPGHRSRGKAREIWSCLRRARSCDDVDACVFAGQKTVCPEAGVFEGCEGDVRFACRPSQHAGGESCALWGQPCSAAGGVATCGVAPDPACTDSRLRDCSPLPDHGPRALAHWCNDAGSAATLDCTSNGAQVCVAESNAAGGWVTCAAESDAACPPDPSVTCTNGVASWCPGGVRETLDCRALLGSPNACAAGPPPQPFEWSAPCRVVPAACKDDFCDGNVLTGCARGASYTVDCRSVGLDRCVMMSTENAGPTHAACTLAQD
jgi:hypothetical protein